MSYFAVKLKQQRAKLNLSMQALADRAEISKSMVCKMERSEVQPTIDVAHRVAAALNISLSEMLHPPEKLEAVIIKHGDQAVWEDSQKIRRRTLSPVFENLAIDWLQIEFPPNSLINKEKINNSKLIEKYLFVTEGCLHLLIQEKPYVLHAGDSFYFRENSAYTVSNPGDVVTRVFIVAHYNQGL